MKKSVLPVIEKIVASLALLTLASCSNDGNPEPVPVTITGFYPSSGIVGSSVTIYGDQFIPTVSPEKGVGPHPNTSIISYNGTVAQAENLYQDSIGKQHVDSEVPAGAPLVKSTLH